MAKVIEFYLRGPVPKKVKPVPIEQRGKLVEFPKENFAAQSKTKDNTGRGEVSPSTVLFFGCFYGHQCTGFWEKWCPWLTAKLSVRGGLESACRKREYFASFQQLWKSAQDFSPVVFTHDLVAG